jgi:hypothetical protein
MILVFHEALAAVQLVQEIIVVDEDEQLDREEVDHTSDESRDPPAALAHGVAHLAPAFHSEEVAYHRNLPEERGAWAREAHERLLNELQEGETDDAG